MTYSELKKLLKKAGCRCEREGKGHEIWINPEIGVPFPVGRHNTEEVPTGTLKNIKKAAGLE